jgi:hypothetical protein
MAVTQNLGWSHALWLVMKICELSNAWLAHPITVNQPQKLTLY